METHSPEAVSEVVERGLRAPTDTDGEASGSLTSAILGEKTTGESVGFVPMKSWKIGFTNCWLPL